ncbi:unnamed protein product [Zymoseptoria tritici ST99CH_1A5]|uniref:ABM domain-containing protein n=1 Tax=Zymoseptoria tritici ST99CH_1A5 TaxID=1276529 RepID=A0A1Y6M1A4_ZYMTR|nr:unnamed protein product [Zymoseptoria tritici ST99CH_1A5]
MPTTEIFIAALKPGSNIGDPSNEAAQTLKSVGDTLIQTDGVQDIHFGMQVESPNTLQLLVTWDKLDSHKTFMSTPTYKPFVDRILALIDGAPSMIHTDLEPAASVAPALAAPVTEIATFYFGGEAPEDYISGVHKFRDILEKEKSDGYLGAAIGLTVEEVEREGHKGKGAVLVIGWESVEKHMAFRETGTFKENIGLLRNGAKTLEMHHVPFMEFVREQ